MLASGLPFFEFLLITLRALGLDALQQRIGGFEFVAVIFAPLRSEFALKGVLQQGLAVYLELLAGGLQAFNALVQFGK